MEAINVRYASELMEKHHKCSRLFKALQSIKETTLSQVEIHIHEENQTQHYGKVFNLHRQLESLGIGSKDFEAAVAVFLRDYVSDHAEKVAQELSDLGVKNLQKVGVRSKGGES